MKGVRTFEVAIVLLASTPLVSTSPTQLPGAASSRPSFEVVSIKPNKSGVGGYVTSYRPGGLYVGTNVSLKSLVMEAYRLQEYQLVGGPNWRDTEKFDIQARAEAAAAPAPDQTRTQILLMLQSMLEDRFRLKIRHEMRELPVYALRVGKGVHKLMKAAEEKGQCGGPGGPMCPGTSTHCCTDGMMDLAAVSVSLPGFAESLSQFVGRRVIDETDLKGLFDIKLRWSRDEVTPTTTAPTLSIFTAVQDQLGLRLESSKGPVDVIVIESAERPTEN